MESAFGYSFSRSSKNLLTATSSSSVSSHAGVYVSKRRLWSLLPTATRFLLLSACCGGSQPQIGMPSGCTDTGNDEIVLGKSSSPSLGGLVPSSFSLGSPCALGAGMGGQKRW